MKITLMKDHSCAEGDFKAGETIEVTEDIYDWLMNIYLTERSANQQLLEEFDKKFARKK